MIATMADGSLTQALQFINKGDDGINRQKRRFWLLKGLSGLILKNLPGAIVSALPLAEGVAGEPQLIEESLVVIRTFIRDLAVFRFNPKAVANADQIPLIQQCIPKVSFNSTVQWIKSLHDVEKKFSSHANARLTFEVFFLEMATQSRQYPAH